MQILDILNQIEATSSRNEKEAIIKANAGNNTLKEVFRLAYDPKINFYMRKVPEPNSYSGTHTLEVALEYIRSVISKRVLTGNKAKEGVEALLSSLSTADATVVTRILKKDLRVGCTSETANKVWKNLVAEYPCMLAQPDKEKTRAKIKFPAVAQYKSDGMRVNAHVDTEEGTVTYISRNGKTVFCNSKTMDGELVQYATYLKSKIFSDRKSPTIIVDGELLWMVDGKVAPREIGNGKCNKATKGEMSAAERDNFMITIWDFIHEEDFNDGICDIVYERKIKHLEFAGEGYTRITMIPSRIVQNWDEANEWFNEVLAEGGEGLIIKNIKHVWENRRSADLVKMKAELENDFEIVGYNEGRGKYEGQIGSYVMASKCGTVEFNCAGMSDEARAQDPEENIGKIAAVRYNMIMPSKDGMPRRAFLPRLIEIREDKSEADSF